MKKPEWLWLLGIGIAFLPLARGVESRIWTSLKGSTLEAQLVKADATGATLASKDGKQFTLKFEDLSLADRQYLVEFGGADKSILTTGEPGQPEKLVKIELTSIKRLKDRLGFGEEMEIPFELTQSEHFLIASAGDVRAEAVAETAERLWHGMAFQHMNFRRDWADKQMLIILAEKRPAYAGLGKWYLKSLQAHGQEEGAQRLGATWDKLGSTTIGLPEDMIKQRNLLPEAVVFNVLDASRFKRPMGPFQIHTIAGALLSKQLGGVSSFGSEGYFALTTGHSYYKEITLGGKSETQILSVNGESNEISSKKGFEDGTSWVRGLKAAVRKGTVKVQLEPMLRWKIDGLKPEELVLIYSCSYYMQSSPEHLNHFAAMVRRIESSNQVPPAIEIAKIFGFDSVEAFNADWENFIKGNNFR